MYLLFAATWLVRRPVGVRMRDMLNSGLDNQPENLSKAGYVCALRGDACARARSVVHVHIHTNKIGIEFASTGSLLSPKFV